MRRALTRLGPLLLVAAVIWLAQRGLREPPPPPTPAQGPALRYEMNHMHWVRLSADGKPELSADAQVARRYSDDSMQMDVVAVDTLGDDRHPPWHLQSPHGRVPPNDKRLQLTHGVVAQRAIGSLEIRTPTLWVDQLRREFYTSDRVVLTGPQRDTRARGLRGDFDGEHLDLLGDVVSTYAPNS